MLPFFPLPPFSRFAAGALNALLGREAWARDRLARHAGKTVRFAWGGQYLSLTISGGGSVASADDAVVPDVTLTLQSDRLAPSRFLGGGLPDFAEVTHISGDAALVQIVGELARDLRWEPEDDLARAVGDIPAARLVSGARAMAAGVRAAAGRLAGNVAEYLAEESAMLAGRPLLEQQRLDLDRLRADARALESSIAALDARLSRAAAGSGR
jgi:ubiquinone biosynthesis protein UbiJ